jgi:uncharacterized membrane protein YgcG
MLGAPDYMKDELTAQKEELQREIATLRRWGQRGATDEELGVAFVDAALRRVDEQLEKVEALKTTSVMTARKKSLREIVEVQERKGKMAEAATLPVLSETSSSEVEAEPESMPHREEKEEEVPLAFLSSRNPNPPSTTLSTNAPAFVPPPSLLTSPKKPPHQRRNVLPPPQPDEDPAFYFYQAASGQPIFLQPLDIRILKSHFGTYQAMPDTIEVLVEGADEGSMNEELRRRCKWLAHLPISSDVVFIESDLSRVVSKKSLEPYSTALKQRRNKRRDKARKEDKAKLRSEQKAAEALPIYQSTGEFGLPNSIPFSTSGFNAPSSWDDFHAFPSPAPMNPQSGTSPLSHTALSTSANSNPSHPPANSAASNWSNRSFASALHATHSSAPYDDDFEDRWNEVEESLGRQRIAGGGGGTSTNGSAKTSANAGGGKKSGGGGGGKKSKKGITLNLSGGGMRGSG